MEGSNSANNDRSAMITMFIVVYVISILCAIIPLYMFFGLPAHAKHEASLKLSASNEKAQKELLEKYTSLVASLDSLLKTKTLDNNYQVAVIDLTQLAKGMKESGDPLFPVFKKVADLFNDIRIYSENSTKADGLEQQVTEMKEQKKKDDEKIEKLEEKVEDLEKQMKNSNQ